MPLSLRGYEEDRQSGLLTMLNALAEQDVQFDSSIYRTGLTDAWTMPEQFGLDQRTCSLSFSSFVVDEDGL